VCPSSRGWHATATVSARLFVFGGYSSGVTNDLWVLDLGWFRFCLSGFVEPLIWGMQKHWNGDRRLHMTARRRQRVSPTAWQRYYTFPIVVSVMNFWF
jgi:hypothetical protein